MKPYAVFLLALLSITSGLAKDKKGEIFDFKSPRNTIENHLFFLQDEHNNPEKSARSLFAPGLSDKKKNQLAVKLKQIFDGKGKKIYLHTIPNDPDHRYRSTGEHIFFPDTTMQDIYLEKQDGKWKYSRHTVLEIEDLHKEVFPYGTHKLLNLVSGFSHEKYLGLYAWQYIGWLILIALAFITHKLFSFLIERALFRVFYKFGHARNAKHYFLPIARPISLVAVSVLLLIFVPVLQLPINIAEYVMMLIKASIPLFFTIIAYRVVDVLGDYGERYAEKTENTLDDQLVPLFKKTLKVFVILIGTLVVLQNLNFNVTAVLAGLSIGGLAFALAAQDTLKNFFGSLMIFIDKPFQIGDWIKGGDIDGSVEEVGFRSTRVRTFHNSLTYVPNGKVADMIVDNMGMRHYRRYSTTIAVTYDTPPETVQAFVEGLRSIVARHPFTRKDVYHIYLNDFGASSLNILLYIFFSVPDWATELKSKHEINIEVMKLADHLGVRFAFPTQTLHVESFPDKTSMTPASVTDKGELTRRLDTFFEQK